MTVPNHTIIATTVDEALDGRHHIRTYLKHTRRSLEATVSNLDNGFYGAAINRAYYALFYAASGLLLVKDVTRSKHSGVIAAFRQRFVKPGTIEAEYSDIYWEKLSRHRFPFYEAIRSEGIPLTPKSMDS